MKEINMNYFEPNWTVEYENIKLVTNLMLLKMNRKNLEILDEADLSSETMEYIKSEYLGHILILGEKIKHELHKNYRLN